MSALEIDCFIELFGNRRRFCRILEIQPPSALYSMPALLKYDVEPLVSGATLTTHLAVDFTSVWRRLLTTAGIVSLDVCLVGPPAT